MDGSRTVEGTRAGVYGQSVDRRLSIFLGKHAIVFHAEVYAILACVHEIETQDRPEKYVRICSDSRAAMKVLEAAKTTSPMVQQCQKALNDISMWHTVGLYWVFGHAGGCEVMKLPTVSQGMVLFRSLWDQSLSWGSQGRT
jgi:hypothetical protein